MDAVRGLFDRNTTLAKSSTAKCWHENCLENFKNFCTIFCSHKNRYYGQLINNYCTRVLFVVPGTC